MKYINNNFNFLRLMLSLCVMIFHTGVLFDVNILKPFPGGLSVSCFFVISGYLIFTSYERSKSLKDYIIKRIKRMVPGLYVLTFLCIILGIFLTNLPLQGYFSKDLMQFITANLLFLNFIHPNLPGVFTNNSTGAWVNGSLWSLKIEIIFYTSVPIILYFCRKHSIKGLTLCLLLSLLFKFICIQCANFIKFSFPEVIQNVVFGSDYSPFATISFFLCGGILYYVKDYMTKYKINHALILPIFCIGIYCIYKGYYNIYFFPMLLALCIIILQYIFHIRLKFLKQLEICLMEFIFITTLFCKPW